MLSIPGGIRLKPEAALRGLSTRCSTPLTSSPSPARWSEMEWLDPHVWCWKLPIDAEKSLESQIWLMKMSYCFILFHIVSYFFPQHFSTNQHVPCYIPIRIRRWWSPKLGVTIPPVAMMRSLCAIITWWGARTSEFLSVFLLVKQLENAMEMTMFLGKDMMNTVDGCRWKYHWIHGHCFGDFYVEPEDVECGLAWTYGLENPVTSYGLKSETSAQIPCGGGMELMVIWKNGPQLCWIHTTDKE